MHATSGLGQNLAKYHDECRRQEKANESAGLVGHEDAEKTVDSDVSEHQRAEEEIPILSDGVDPSRVPGVDRVFPLHDDLESGLVEAQKAQNKTRTQSRPHEQQDNDDVLDRGGDGGEGTGVPSTRCGLIGRTQLFIGQGRATGDVARVRARVVV